MKNSKGIILSVLMVASSALAMHLSPTLVASDARQQVDLERIIPQQFGGWTNDRGMAQPIVSPDTEAELQKYYTTTLSRTYVRADGARIMLSLAYGADQGRAMQVHKPEICYEAQGFKINYSKKEQIDSVAGEIPVMRLDSRKGPREEPITYWIRFGDVLVRGWFEQNKERIMTGLIDRKIPDGLLVRVSSISDDRESAYKDQDDFVKNMLSSMSHADQKMLVGTLGRNKSTQ